MSKPKNTIIYEAGASPLTDVIAQVQAVTEETREVYSKLLEVQSALSSPAETAPSVTEPVKKKRTVKRATNDNFRDESHRFNSELSKDERQENGIYFTPKAVRDRLFGVLSAYGVKKPKSVLEPSAGSGEFVYDAAALWPKARIYAVEKHEKLHAALKGGPKIQTINSDFLLYTGAPVEVVIGNPPYFVTKEKQPECMTGRGNIYVQFIYKCLTSHLVDGGVLAFVLPTSFYNCSYYEPCRKYMLEHTTVLHLENLDADFYDTAQDTMLMVVKRAPPPPPSAEAPPYFLSFGGGNYLSPHYAELRTLLSGVSTVRDLGLAVKTGEVVWNQHKAKLHDREGDLVIYSSNIVDNNLVLNNLGGEKKQYIRGFGKPPVAGPAVLIGRGYGNKFHFAHVFIPAGTAFHGENHINVVTGPATALARFKKSLDDPRTADFLRMFVGNGALSKSEIEALLPVF